MQISKINAFYDVKPTTCSKIQNKRYVQKNTTDTFEKSKPLSFGANIKDVVKYNVDWGYENFVLPTVAEFDVHYPKQRKLNILKGDESHLKNVAESLCMYSDEDIENFSKIYYPFRFDVNQAKSAKAYARIMPYIQEQRTKLLNLHDIKDSLESRKEMRDLSIEEENGLQYINEELERIDDKCRKASSEYLTIEHFEVDDGSDDSWQID